MAKIFVGEKQESARFCYSSNAQASGNRLLALPCFRMLISSQSHRYHSVTLKCANADLAAVHLLVGMYGTSAAGLLRPAQLALPGISWVGHATGRRTSAS